MNKSLLTIFSLLALTTTTSCVPVLFAGAATAVGTTAIKDKTFGETIDDVKLSAKINTELVRKHKHLFSRISILSYQGKVVLLGKVKTHEQKEEAEKIVNNLPETRKLINEIVVDNFDNYNAGDYTRDGAITTHVKAKLLTLRDVRSVNYNVSTVDKVVYIVGIALSQDEHDKVINAAREVVGVNKVISYIEVKSS